MPLCVAINAPIFILTASSSDVMVVVFIDELITDEMSMIVLPTMLVLVASSMLIMEAIASASRNAINDGELVLIVEIYTSRVERLLLLGIEEPVDLLLLLLTLASEPHRT